MPENKAENLREAEKASNSHQRETVQLVLLEEASNQLYIYGISVQEAGSLTSRKTVLSSKLVGKRLAHL